MIEFYAKVCWQDKRGGYHERIFYSREKLVSFVSTLRHKATVIDRRHEVIGEIEGKTITGYWTWWLSPKLGGSR